MILDQINDCGYPVVAIASDLGGGNRGLHNDLDIQMNKPWKVFQF